MILDRLFFSAAPGAILSISWVLAPCAIAKVWTDTSGGFTIEADFVSLAEGVVWLKTPAGKVIKVPLAKLAEADRKVAVGLSGESGRNVTPGEGGIMTTARGGVKSLNSMKDGKAIKVTRLFVNLEMSGGIVPGVYAFALAGTEPMFVGDQKMSHNAFGTETLQVVDKEGDSTTRKLEMKLDFGEVPADTKSVGPLKGSVVVCMGGEEHEIEIEDPLTSPVGMMNHPALKKMGIGVKFVRHGNDNSAAFLFDFDRKEIYRFAGLEVVKKDGTVVKRSAGSGSSGDKEARSISVRHEELEGNTLRLRIRDGARKVEVPFEVKTIPVK
ncbi:MAG: SHD1 domain-containing protein [Akkermansiaceae bacterium]